jgi:hypothetical protein
MPHLRIFSTTEIAAELGVSAWMVRRVAGDVKRIGTARAFTSNDLPRLRQLLEAAGYLKPEAAK